MRPAGGSASRLWSLVAVGALLGSIAAHGAGSRVVSAPTLVVDNSFVLDTTDPQRAFDPTSYIVDRAVYDTLFTHGRDDLTHPIPLLVESWSSAGAKRFTFRLRRDVHFADGAPLTSADVVFSLRRLVNLKGNPAHILTGFKVTTTDRYTVVIESSIPAPQLPSILTSASTGIVNSKLVESHGGTDAIDAATADRAENWFNSSDSLGAGSGPYVLQSYSPTSQVTLRPNPDYWGATKPAFDSVVLRNMSAPVQLLNVRRGSHEIALDLSSQQAQTLQGDTRLHVTRQPSPWVFYVFANDDPQVSPVTSNRRFQDAVRHALDYQGLLSVAGRGAVQAPGIIPSMILGALAKEDAFRRDVAKAKVELAASGVGTEQVRLEYPSDVTINGVPFETLAQRVQVDLQAAGFDVALAGSPVTIFQPKFRAGRIAFGLWLYSFDYPDPVDYQVFMPGNLIALHAGWQRGSDPVIERLAANALVTTDPTERKSLYRRIQVEMNAHGRSSR
jgi:peptide/nickel transport system substrate-binding protein